MISKLCQQKSIDGGHALLMNVNRNGTTFESTEEKKHLKGYQARDHVFKFQAVRGGVLPS